MISAGVRAEKNRFAFRPIVAGLSAVCLGMILVSMVIDGTVRDPHFTVSGRLKVIAITDPAALRGTGIEVGDEVLAVNGAALQGKLDYYEAYSHLPAGTEVALTFRRGDQSFTAPIRLGTLPLTLDYFARNLLALAFLAVGTVAGWQAADDRAARLFFLATLALALYFTLSTTDEVPLVYVQTAALCLAPALTLHFFMTFPEERLLAGTRRQFMLYVPSLVLMALAMRGFSQAVIERGGTFRAGEFWHWINISFGYLAASALLGLLILLRATNTRRESILRRQVQWIVWGLALSILAAVVDLVLTATQLQTSLSSGLLMLGTLPLPLGFGFAILRYRLLDVEFVINRSIVYGVLTAGLVAIYLVIVAGLSAGLGLAVQSSDYTLVLFISALFIGLVAAPARNWMQHTMDRVFFRQELDYQHALGQWSEALATSLQFTSLTNLLLEEVPQQLMIENAGLLVLNEDANRLEPLAPESSTTPPLGLPVGDPFTVWLAREKVAVWEGGREADGLPALPGAWRDAGIRVALPLLVGGQLLGLYLLGQKRSLDLYRRRELDLLRTLANQAAITIANARLYEQVRASEQWLEKKVEERTRELRDSLAIVYHELRIPITAVQGYADMVLEGEAGPVNERQQRFLRIIWDNVCRLNDLVNDLSEVTQIEAGRIRLNCEPLDLKAVAEETVASLSSLIDERGLKVEISPAPAPPLVNADRKRVMQILTNLIGNACHYTPVGGRVWITFDLEGAYVQTKVQDTGIGIPPDEIDHIFERFFRGQDPLVRDQRGTGLGLSIAKSLVELHGGHLWVETQVGQGSVFGFTLPL